MYQLQVNIPPKKPDISIVKQQWRSGLKCFSRNSGETKDQNSFDKYSSLSVITMNVYYLLTKCILFGVDVTHCIRDIVFKHKHHLVVNLDVMKHWKTKFLMCKNSVKIQPQRLGAIAETWQVCSRTNDSIIAQFVGYKTLKMDNTTFFFLYTGTWDFSFFYNNWGSVIPC